MQCIERDVDECPLLMSAAYMSLFVSVRVCLCAFTIRYCLLNQKQLLSLELILLFALFI